MAFRDLGKTKEETREITTFAEWNDENYDDTLEEITRYTYMEYDNCRDEYLADNSIRHED